MGACKCRASAIAVLLLLAQVCLSMVIERQDLTLTALSASAASDLVNNNLTYTANCTAASQWHNDLPTNNAGLVTGAGAGNNSINIAFLRASLPPEYQNSSDTDIATFYQEMSQGNLASTDWLGTAVDDVEAVCLAPKIEKQLTLDQLNATQNCSATAQFLTDLGWAEGTRPYSSALYSNNSAWLDFIFYALPNATQNNITDVELDAYYDHLATSTNESMIGAFLNNSYTGCSTYICEAQGYTGNPDIGGIGVLASYTAEAALVTLYFIAVNAEIYFYGLYPPIQKNPSRFLKAFRRASEELLDGALFFSLSISSAGWVSLHSGRSYYEKLVFTSANVLALSALFAFIAMFPDASLQKRGHVIFLVIGSILVESSIQYVAYLAEHSSTKYPDYECLHDKFGGRYHPAIFESLFFLLLGLCVVGGAVYLWFYRYKGEELKRWKADHGKLSGVRLWAFRARIFVEVVAISVVWTECIYLYKIRWNMEAVAGASWQENQWGFGQILALFVWAPPVLSIIATLILPKSMTGKEEEEEIELEEYEGEKDGNKDIPETPVADKSVPVPTISAATGREPQ